MHGFITLTHETLLSENVKRMSDLYNTQVWEMERNARESLRKIDNFVEYDDAQIKWSSGLKLNLVRALVENRAEFTESKLRIPSTVRLRK